MDVIKKLAKRTFEVEWSGIRAMNAMAKQIDDVVNLTIGQPDFDTPGDIIEAAKKSLDEGYTRYPPTNGYEDLRMALAEKLQKQNNIVADPNSEIFVAVGAMQTIFNTVLHLVEPGEEVIVIDPGFDCVSQTRLFGGVPISVPVREENGFKVDPDDIRKAVTNKTKLMILNTPSNPTGAMLDEDILVEIAKIAQQYEIFVLSDEPYEDIVFDGKKHVCIGSLEGMQDLTITAFTFSKSYAMTGWRVGYAVAHKAIVDEMNKLQEHMVTGVASVSQRAALSALEVGATAVQEMSAKYQKRRDIVFEGLNSIEGLSCVLPEGAFYAFPNISRTGKDSWTLAKYLVREHKVAVVPGIIFGKQGEGHVRISFASSSENLKNGITRLKRGIEGCL